MSKFLTPINLAQNELQNARIQNLPTASAPSTPVEGQIFADTTLHVFKFHNGTSFVTYYTNTTTLNNIAAPTASLSLNSQKITSLANGSAASDAAAFGQIPLNGNGILNTSGTWSVKASDASISVAAGGISVAFAGTGSAVSAAHSDHNHDTTYLGLGGGTLTGALTLAADPVSAMQAATKQYVDNAAVGLLDFKNSVHLATTAALPALTYNNGSSGVGATLTASANGALSVDSIAVATGDRILVKNQASPVQNGIYTVTNTGNAGAAFVLTRATDADNSTEVNVGLYTYVETGTSNAGTGWVASATSNADGKSVVLGTDSITITQFTGAGAVTGGNGIAQTGNNLYISSTTLNVATDTLDLATLTDGGTGSFLKFTRDTYGRVSGTSAVTTADVNALNITQVGTIATGTWSGTTIAINKGGTGQTTSTAAFDALSPLTTLGDTIYHNGSNNVRLAGNTTTTKQFLSQTGNGSISANPSWSVVTKSDVGLGNVENTALSTWTGSTSITTLGTIATGTWQGTLVAGQYGGTGVANTGKTITIGGNFTTSGAFTTTLTVTNNTNVTLPTAGTLAILGANTFTAKQTFVAPSTSTASILIPNGAADPTTPVSGDLWANTGAMKWYNGAATKTIAFLDSNITGTASNVTGTVAIANGGTGQTSAAAGFNALSPLTTLGDIIYASGANTAARLAGNITTTKQFLSQTGNASVSAAPVWSVVSKADVGLGNVENTALSTWTGSTSITTLGTIATGTWSGTTIALNKGGTNAALTAVNTGIVYSTASAMAIGAAGTNGQWLKLVAGAPTWSDLTADSVAKKYSTSIGDGTTTAITVTHSLASRDVQVIVYDNASFDQVYADVNFTTTNTVTLTFAVAPTTNQYRVVVVG